MLPSSWFVRGGVMFMSASKRFAWPSCYHQINGKSVGAYRIRPSHWRKSMFDGIVLLDVIVSFPLTWGRMRYAPTPVRLKFGLVRVMGEFRFRSHQGVCDTPLHLFGWNLGFVGGMGGFHFRSHQGVCDTPLHLFDENECLSNEKIMPY